MSSGAGRRVHPAYLAAHAGLHLEATGLVLMVTGKMMRTYAFGREAGALQGARYDEEMFFLGAVLLDLGLVEKFIRQDRFEIDGADAAADFLSRQGYSDRKIAVIWDAIALHTTPGVPQREQPEIALVQLGAGIDVGAVPRSLVTPESVEIILAEYPLRRPSAPSSYAPR